ALEISLGLERALPNLLLQRGRKLDRCRHAEIGLDEKPLERLEVVRVEAADDRVHIGERDALEAGPQRLFVVAEPGGHRISVNGGRGTVNGGARYLTPTPGRATHPPASPSTQSANSHGHSRAERVAEVSAVRAS